MLKILYAACPGLTLVISAQFALEMCIVAQNRQKLSLLFIVNIN